VATIESSTIEGIGTDHWLARRSFSGTTSLRWSHAWAIATLICAFVAISSGALVTTLRVGMADPIWPTAPWTLFVISWQEPRPGFLIEHGHRLADWVTGFCSIGLAVSLWRSARSSLMRWLGIAAMMGVALQGLLGGLRVLLHALQGPGLAWFHGAFGQAFFAFLSAIVVVTSSQWQPAPPREDDKTLASGARRAALALVGLTYLQGVLGGVIRHFNAAAGYRLHLLLAFAVVAAVVWLWRTDRDVPGMAIRMPLLAITLLLVIQLGLGVEALMIRFASGKLFELATVTPAQAWVRTAHFVCAALILAFSVVAALRVYHPYLVARRLAATEGAA
jgi:heme A synthase